MAWSLSVISLGSDRVIEFSGKVVSTHGALIYVPNRRSLAA
jgi:hypothetical protein